MLSLPQRVPPDRQVETLEPLHLQIAADGRIALDGETIAPRLFRAEMAFLAARAEPPLVEVDPADQVSYAHVVSVLSDLKAAGITRVGFRER